MFDPSEYVSSDEHEFYGDGLDGIDLIEFDETTSLDLPLEIDDELEDVPF